MPSGLGVFGIIIRSNRKGSLATLLLGVLTLVGVISSFLPRPQATGFQNYLPMEIAVFLNVVSCCNWEDLTLLLLLAKSLMLRTNSPTLGALVARLDGLVGARICAPNPSLITATSLLGDSRVSSPPTLLHGCICYYFIAWYLSLLQITSILLDYGA